MHDCNSCGMACACDGEDAYGAPQPDDCTHVCDEDDQGPTLGEDAATDYGEPMKR